jgi:hypothetical protein
MAETVSKLDNCPDCAHPISPEAIFCPHCGAWFGDENGGIGVTIKSVKMKFTEVMRLLIQVSLAAIPAALLVGIVVGVVIGFVAVLVGRQLVAQLVGW